MTETHIVPNLPAPIRRQEYGVGIFIVAPTKSALKKALKKDYVTVNDAIATSATFIRGGECIRLSIPAGAGPKTKLVFPLKVLLEDDHLAVLHKPAGILVSGNSFKTIAFGSYAPNLYRITDSIKVDVHLYSSLIIVVAALISTFSAINA